MVSRSARKNHDVGRAGETGGVKAVSFARRLRGRAFLPAPCTRKAVAEMRAEKVFQISAEEEVEPVAACGDRAPDRLPGSERPSRISVVDLDSRRRARTFRQSHVRASRRGSRERESIVGLPRVKRITFRAPVAPVSPWQCRIEKESALAGYDPK